MITNELKKEIGQRIRAFRVSNNLTQAQFAENINISINFLSEIENGKKGLSCDTLISICNINSVSSDYILFGTEKKDSLKNIAKLADTLSPQELSTTIEYLIALQKLKEITNND